jgi:hypothetical protein
MEDEKKLYVGVVGYSQQEFDETEATIILEEAFESIEDEYLQDGDFDSIVLVSGLTNMGIPSIAYQIAENNGYETVGIAPDAASEYELYDVDEIYWVGENWGDESQAFIDMIDVIIRVGGGEQSMKEVEMAEEEDISVIEYDL